MQPLHEVVTKRVVTNVIRLRHERGLSMKQLADLVGISVPYVSQLESGNRKPSLHMVCRIAAALGVDPSTLMKE